MAQSGVIANAIPKLSAHVANNDVPQAMQRRSKSFVSLSCAKTPTADMGLLSKPASSSSVDSGGAVTPKSDASLKLSVEDEAWLVPSVFDDDKLAKYYEPPPNYESRHRFDPKARWTKEEDAAVVRKCDLRLFSFVFYVCFLFMELPSQLISKWLGVDVWVPVQMMAWSLVAILQCTIRDVRGFYATRALLGALEGGFNIILFLSYTYTAAELAMRLSWFWVCLSATQVVGSFLAAAILPLRGVNGWEGWRYLFLIEGLITFAIGLFAAVWLPASPTQTRSWFRGSQGWFTEREETIIVMRVLRDDPQKASMHNREAIGFKQLWKSLTDFDHWPLYLLGLGVFIPVGTVQAYFTLVLRSIGFSVFHTNLLQIPYLVLFMINNLVLSYASKRIKERTFMSSVASWCMLIILSVVVAVPHAGKWVKYALLSLLLAYPYPHPILVSWNSANSGSVRTRSVSASLYNMCVQAGSIISSNVYRQDDKPLYEKGNRILLGVAAANIALFGLAKVYFIARNRYKSSKWEGMSPDERAHYLQTTKDEGNRRLDFQLVH
ncbi:hypothetical protein OIV83_006021 [Microbotryomycetes sp. JL201]|nr:hypothetical protein OIV83_006021 [Microbotryomycetes sp. JL201]